jgi:hypothetical protein
VPGRNHTPTGPSLGLADVAARTHGPLSCTPWTSQLQGKGGSPSPLLGPAGAKGCIHDNGHGSNISRKTTRTGSGGSSTTKVDKWGRTKQTQRPAHLPPTTNQKITPLNVEKTRFPRPPPVIITREHRRKRKNLTIQGVARLSGDQHVPTSLLLNPPVALTGIPLVLRVCTPLDGSLVDKKKNTRML